MSCSELRTRAAALISQATELEADELIRRERKRRGLAEADSLAEYRRYTQLAAEARARGDHAAASSFARAAEAEALAAATGL